MERDGTAPDEPGPFPVHRPRPPHCLRAAVDRCTQGRPDPVRPRRRDRGRMAVDRQHLRVLGPGGTWHPAICGRVLGAGRRRALPPSHRLQPRGAGLMDASPVLLADIGGTHARFALGDASADMPLLDDTVRKYPVTGFASLADAARGYLRETGARTTRAVFAVAARIDDGQA